MAVPTRDLVVDLYASYERRDFARVANLLHDDIDWIIYGPTHLFPFVGQRRGKADTLAALGAIADEYDLESYKPEIMIVEDERAAVVSDVAFRQRSTNRLLRFRLANFMRFRDGRIIEFREFANTFDLAEQALGRWLDVDRTDAISPRRPS